MSSFSLAVISEMDCELRVLLLAMMNVFGTAGLGLAMSELILGSLKKLVSTDRDMISR